MVSGVTKSIVTPGSTVSDVGDTLSGTPDSLCCRYTYLYMKQYIHTLSLSIQGHLHDESVTVTTY